MTQTHGQGKREAAPPLDARRTAAGGRKREREKKKWDLGAAHLFPGVLICVIYKEERKCSH